MSFLTKKVGPLPTWGWGAVAAGGTFLLLKGGGGGGKGPKNAADNGGQSIPNYNFKTTMSQNIGGDSVSYATHPFGDGSHVSEIDESFFGNGPLSLWTGGPMEYTGVFRDHRGRDRGEGQYGRRGSRHYGPRGGGRDEFNPPPGGGGFGYHHWKGPGFPPPPSGGEGFDNGGQSYTGGSGGGPARTGGNPWNQQVTQGTQGGSYTTRQGDNLQSIAEKLWGPGSDSSGLESANGNILQGRGNRNKNGSVRAGLVLTVPGAPSSGPPAPGGPAGNGVGGGSINASGSNPGQHPAFPGMAGNGQAEPGAGTSSAGAGGGGSPTDGQSGGNSSRVKSGNASRSYAVSGSQGGGNNTKTRQQSSKRGR